MQKNSKINKRKGGGEIISEFIWDIRVHGLWND